MYTKWYFLNYPRQGNALGLNVECLKLGYFSAMPNTLDLDGKDNHTQMQGIHIGWQMSLHICVHLHVLFVYTTPRLEAQQPCLRFKDTTTLLHKRTKYRTVIDRVPIWWYVGTNGWMRLFGECAYAVEGAYTVECAFAVEYAYTVEWGGCGICVL